VRYHEYPARGTTRIERLYPNWESFPPDSTTVGRQPCPKTPPRHRRRHTLTPLSMNAIMASGSGGGSPLFKPTSRKLNRLFDSQLFRVSRSPANRTRALGSSSSSRAKDSRGVESVCLGPVAGTFNLFFSLGPCHHSQPYFTKDQVSWKIRVCGPCTAVKTAETRYIQRKALEGE
jgi:hypothetical protein